MRHILVVDDDPAIVSAVAEGLPLLLDNAKVTTAQSGESARRIMQAGPQVDVVVCDARMPGLAGLDLLAWMKARQHPAKRILISGYGREAFPNHELERVAPVLVMTKPVSLAELAKAAA